MITKETYILIWMPGAKYMIDRYGQVMLTEKPGLDFSYDTLSYYSDGTDQTFTLESAAPNVAIRVSPRGAESCERFIRDHRTRVGILKLCVDAAGKYLGHINKDDPRVFQVVDFAPPNGDDWVWDFENSKWIRAYYYDQEGVLTTEHSGTAVGYTTIEPPIGHYPLPFKWSTIEQQWILESSGQWGTVVKNKLILEGLNDLLSHTLEMMHRDNQLAQSTQSLASVLSSVSSQIAALPFEGMTEERRVSITDTCARLQQIVTSVNSGVDLLTLQEMFYDHKLALNTSNVYAIPTSSDPALQDLIVDMYVNQQPNEPT